MNSFLESTTLLLVLLNPFLVIIYLIDVVQKLPVDAFDIQGRLLRVDGGVAIEGVDARIGGATLEVEGMVGDPPALAGTDLRFATVVPTASKYSRLVRMDLPAERFEASGRLVPEGDRVVLEGVKARLGANTLSADGGIATTEGLVGTDIRLQAAGYDMEVAHDGESGLDRLAHMIPDVVLLDIRMPGIDGLEVMKQMKQDRRLAEESDRARRVTLYEGFLELTDQPRIRPQSVKIGRRGQVDAFL